MDLIRKQRIRFTVSTTLLMAVFLLALFLSYLALTAFSDEIDIRRNLEKAIDNPKTYNIFAPQGQLCTYFLQDQFGVMNEASANSGYDAQTLNKIKDAAKKAKNGKFSVGDRYFAVNSKPKDSGETLFAVLDITYQREQLVNTALQIVLLYLCAVALISLLAFLASASLLKPVKEALYKQRDLIANASHELKTPLTIISTDMSVIQSEPTSSIEDNAKWIDSINSQISRMQELIQNMLELSKMEQSELKKELVQLSVVAEGACLTFEPVCFEKSVELQTDIQPGLACLGDKSSLERLFVILLDNAIKYCGDNGKVGFNLVGENKKIRITVMNTGEIISKEDAQHVFDRFYRTDGARRNEDNQSFGLGLSIAKATVVAHGGTIACHGIENKGTVFTVVLPKAPAPKRKNSRHHHHKRPKPAAKAQTPRKN